MLLPAELREDLEVFLAMSQDRLRKDNLSAAERAEANWLSMVAYELIHPELVKGMVYVMANLAMPGLVKIGRSLDPMRRVAQLSGLSAIPVPFELFHTTCPVPNAVWVEDRAHRELNEYRINPDREFFKVSCENAAEVVDTAVSSYHDHVTSVLERIGNSLAYRESA